MVTIRTYFNNAEAWLAKSVLASEGIEADVASDSVNTFYAIALPARLQGPEKDSERALAILDQHEVSLPQQPPESTPAPAPTITPETAGSTEAEQIPERKIGSPSLAREWAPLAFGSLAALVVAWMLFTWLAPPQWLYSENKLITAGNAFLEKKDYDSALKYYNAALALKPADADAHYDRGLAYYDKGDSARALADFSDSIKADPKDILSYTMRGRIHRQNGETALALADFDRAIELAPGRPEGYLDRALLHEDTGDSNAIISDLNMAIDLDHGSSRRPLMISDRAYAYYNLGNYDQAFADANEALNSDDPTVYKAHVTRGFIYAEREEYDKALADFQAALEHDPDYGLALEGRGGVFSGMHEYDKALADFSRAIEINPTTPSLYLELGYVHSKLGQPNKAIEDYKNAMKLAPEAPGAYNNLAWLYATYPRDGVRDGAKAMELAAKACDLSQWKDHYCIGTLAAAEAETGKFDDAVKNATQELAMAQDDKTVSKETLAEMADALKDYQQGKPYRDTSK